MSRKKRKNKSHATGANAEALRQRHHTVYGNPLQRPLPPSSHSHKLSNTRKPRYHRPKKNYHQRDPTAGANLGGEEVLDEHDNATTFLIQTPNFARLVEQITEEAMEKLGYEGKREWEGAALDVLQEVTEAHLVGFFEDVSLCTKLSNIVTIQGKHVRLARRLIESADTVGLTVGIPGEGSPIEAAQRGLAQPEDKNIVNILTVRSKRRVDSSVDAV